MKYIKHSQGPWRKHKYIRKEGTGATTKYIYSSVFDKHSDSKKGDVRDSTDHAPDGDSKKDTFERDWYRAEHNSAQKIKNSEAYKRIASLIATLRANGASDATIQAYQRQLEEMLSKGASDAADSAKRAKQRTVTIARAEKEHPYDSKSGRRVGDTDKDREDRKAADKNAKSHANAMAAESQAEADANVRRQKAKEDARKAAQEEKNRSERNQRSARRRRK